MQTEQPCPINRKDQAGGPEHRLRRFDHRCRRRRGLRPSGGAQRRDARSLRERRQYRVYVRLFNQPRAQRLRRPPRRGQRQSRGNFGFERCQVGFRGRHRESLKQTGAHFARPLHKKRRRIAPAPFSFVFTFNRRICTRSPQGTAFRRVRSSPLPDRQPVRPIAQSSDRRSYEGRRSQSTRRGC